MKISVIMPVFNAEKFLNDSIQSILGQTHQNLELIIVDDASTDSSYTIMTHWAAQDPRIVIAQHSKNQGAAATRNTCFSYCSGDYIAHMDADDISHKKRLETQLNYLIRHNYDLVGSNIIVIDETNTPLHHMRLPECDHDIKIALAGSCPIVHPSILGKIDIINTPQRDLATREDYFWYYELSLKGMRFGNVQKNLLKYRRHSNNLGVYNRNLPLKHAIANSFAAQFPASSKKFNQLAKYNDTENLNGYINSAFTQYKQHPSIDTLLTYIKMLIQTTGHKEGLKAIYRHIRYATYELTHLSDIKKEKRLLAKFLINT